MDRHFNERELAKIKKVIEHLFSSLAAKVEIIASPKAISTFQDGSGVVVEENYHSYDVAFRSPQGNVDLTVHYPEGTERRMAAYGWDIGVQIYNRLSDAFGGKVFAEGKIWPRDNNYQPDLDFLENLD